MLPSIEQRLATELAVKFSQIQATIQLLDDGATVPFIARYRKEATGGLDDAQLRLLAEGLHNLRELEKRRAAIIAATEKLGKITPPLLDALTHATDKAHLEDLYHGILISGLKFHILNTSDFFSTPYALKKDP